MLLKIFYALSALVAVWAGFCCEGMAWLWVAPLAFAGGFLACLILAFLFLWLLSALVDPHKEQVGDDPFYRRVIEAYAEAISILLGMKVDVQGMEKLPQNGRFLLVCNHLSLLDVVVMVWKLRGMELTFITKQENMRLFIAGKMMHKIQCLPLNRENDREALKTILRCIQILKEDKASIAVFPEGHIHKDKKLHHFRSGVFKIATKSKVPIVVCTIRDTRFVLSKLKKLQPSSVEVRLLRVIEPEEYENMTTVDLAEQIYQTMAQDLGPDLVSREEEKA